MKRLYHQELKGGYTSGKKIIIDSCEIDGGFEVMTLYEDGEELACVTVATIEECKREFDKMVLNYLEPLQKAVATANLKEGKRYTLFYFNDFGFPVCSKITYHGIAFETYAQHSDVTRLIFTPYRKRTKYSKRFYNCSFAIFEGWQDLKESDTSDIVKETKDCKMIKLKYGCFDSKYIEDGIKILKNPVVIYRNYKTGVNGKIYA